LTDNYKILISKINKNLNLVWVGIFLFLLAVVAPWFNLTISNHDIVKSYFASFGIAFLMLLALYYKCQNSDVSLNINYIKSTLFLLFLFGTLSALWSINFDFTLGKWLLWVIAAFSFMLSLNLSITHENLIKLSWGLIIAAGAIAIIGLLQRFFDPFSLTEAAWPASTFGNKNMAAQTLVLIFPLSIFLLFSKLVQGLKVWTLLGITSLILAYIIFTESRAAWLSIIIELFFLIIYFVIRRATVSEWINWSRNKGAASIIALLLTIILINLNFSGEFHNTFAEVSQRIASTGSISDGASLQRFQIWSTAIQMIVNAPLIGTGLGSYAQNLGNEGYATWTINNTMRVHNDLIELAVELGLIGVIIFFTAVIAIIISIFKILKKTVGDFHLFFLVIFSSLIGSFVNLQFSFPYQMAFPLLLFGLYIGLIAKYLDKVVPPLKSIKFSIRVVYKKIILLISASLILIIFYLTYFQWIIAYDQLDTISSSADFSQLEVIETPVYEQKFQFMLYSLGGRYFNKGNYTHSKVIDKKFLEVWPNHLDVLYRAAYAEHWLGQNSNALELAKKLKKLEPQGLYNGYIVEMFVYSSTNDLNKLEQTFKELISQPEQFLKLNDDTYRFLIFFTLASNNLSKHAPLLYEKFIDSHGYSCEVENNLAIHYFNLENFISSVKHIKRTIGKEQKCLNPELIRLLSKKNLIDQKKYL
jgi:O-antigen ligase